MISGVSPDLGVLVEIVGNPKAREVLLPFKNFKKFLSRGTKGTNQTFISIFMSLGNLSIFFPSLFLCPLSIQSKDQYVKIYTK